MEEEEIEIGDVGFLNDGSFIRFFNVVRPREHPVNSADVLKDMEEMPLSAEYSVYENTQDIPRGPLCTATVSHKKPSQTR